MTNPVERHKTVIVGAGAAGLMAAGSVAGGGALVLEKNEKAGKKLYITGKGRCNVTNDCTLDKLLDHVVTNPRFLYGAFSRFSPQDTMRFFQQNGIDLKTERGGRVFPVSDKASDITAALKKHAEQNGATIRCGAEVCSIDLGEDGTFLVRLTGGGVVVAQNVILATGGKSYPLTGSTGDGYRFAKQLGHAVVPPRPALVPIRLAESVKELEGLSLKNVAVMVQSGNKTHREFGEMLFTADGVSGPSVLSLSSHLSHDGMESDATLHIDLKPALTHQQLDARVLRDFGSLQNKLLKNALFDLLPKRLVDFVIQKSNLNGMAMVNAVTKEQRFSLVSTLKNLTFLVSGLGAIEKGIVTGGGVDVRQVNPKTMESKLVPHLYFSGELLDVDAQTGGYNIQIALATGYLAGISIESIES